VAAGSKWRICPCSCPAHLVRVVPDAEQPGGHQDLQQREAHPESALRKRVRTCTCGCEAVPSVPKVKSCARSQQGIPLMHFARSASWTTQYSNMS